MISASQKQVPDFAAKLSESNSKSVSRAHWGFPYSSGDKNGDSGNPDHSFEFGDSQRGPIMSSACSTSNVSFNDDEQGIPIPSKPSVGYWPGSAPSMPAAGLNKSLTPPVSSSQLSSSSITQAGSHPTRGVPLASTVNVGLNQYTGIWGPSQNVGYNHPFYSAGSSSANSANSLSSNTLPKPASGNQPAFFPTAHPWAMDPAGQPQGTPYRGGPVRPGMPGTLYSGNSPHSSPPPNAAYYPDALQAPQIPQFSMHRSTLSQESINSNRSSKKNGRPSTNTDLYKTELCASYMSTGGNCPYGEKCQFAHGRDELKSVDRPPKWRSKPCQNWIRTGTCSYNERCCFRHDIPPAGQPSGLNQSQTLTPNSSHSPASSSGQSHD